MGGTISVCAVWFVVCSLAAVELRAAAAFEDVVLVGAPTDVYIAEPVRKTTFCFHWAACILGCAPHIWRLFIVSLTMSARCVS